MIADNYDCFSIQLTSHFVSKSAIKHLFCKKKFLCIEGDSWHDITLEELSQIHLVRRKIAFITVNSKHASILCAIFNIVNNSNIL